MAKVILIANQKGGVGKSTIATTLGTGLKRLGHAVLLLDADSQQSLFKWRASAEGLAHEQDIPWVERWDSPLIAEKIKKEKKNYDFIIIDSASNLGQKGDATQKIILGAIKSADLILTPVGPSPFDVDGTEDFINLLRDIWERFGEQKPPVYFLINGVQVGTTLGREVGEYVASTYQLPVLNVKLQMRQAYRQCIFDGSSIFHLGDAQSKANASAFIDEILGLFATDAANQKAVEKMSKKGFFANRKTSQAAQTNLGSPESRFDLEEFEREVVAEARENNKIAHIAKEQIDPDPNQPRSEFDQDAMDELRISIEQNGLIQPIVVRQIGERYQIIAGERRWRACLMIASISAIDAVVRNDVDPLTILLLQIAENNHRQSMTPMDIARAYQRVKEFSGNSQKKAAIRLGVSESQISITLGLIKSPELIQNLAMSGKIRDITTLNIVNRLYEQDVIAAKKVVDDILKGRIDVGSVRKQVNSLLQKSKGKIEHAQFVKHHIKADTVDLVQEGKTIIVRLKSKKASYDIELPIGVNELTKLLTALQEKPTNE